jgi:hypothetical protein
VVRARPTEVLLGIDCTSAEEVLDGGLRKRMCWTAGWWPTEEDLLDGGRRLQGRGKEGWGRLAGGGRGGG